MHDAVDYIDEIKSLLISASFVLDVEILREEAIGNDGLYRLRAKLADGTELQMFERFKLVEQASVVVGKYSFHWQQGDGTLIKRWDNAPHHPEIASFPHHVHEGREDNVKPSAPMNGTQIFKLIENMFFRENY